MITSKDCLAKYGVPEMESNMTLVLLPERLRFNKVLPQRIYCNKDMRYPLIMALQLIQDRNLGPLIESWNGCFNIRMKRGNLQSYSLHAWGIAIDINAEKNGYGCKPLMDCRLVRCFTDAGFEWGGFWKIPDGMHFQLTKI